MYSNKCVGTRNSSINWIFLWRLPMQNHTKPSITEERGKTTKCHTWSFIRSKFLKKTSMPDSVKRLGYIKCHHLSLLFASFSKTLLTTESRLTGWQTSLFPNILKYRDHQWQLSTIWKTKVFQTHIEKFSIKLVVCLKGQAHNSLEPSLE